MPKTLPVAPRPEEGELISSWLSRVAAANDLSLRCLIAALILRVPKIMGGAAFLDYGLTFEMCVAVADFCRTSVSTIWALQRCEQMLLPKDWQLRYWRTDSGSSTLAWTSRARYDFCPECIGEMVRDSGFAWIRSEWAWAPLTHCLSHGVPLWERCPVCFTEDPLLFAAPRSRARAGSCRTCNFSLANAGSLTITGLNERVKASERFLFAVARRKASPRSRALSSDLFVQQAVHAIERLMQESDGLPLFVALADQKVECAAYLRGRRRPETKLAFLSWSWRLLLGDCLADLLLENP